MRREDFVEERGRAAQERERGGRHALELVIQERGEARGLRAIDGDLAAGEGEGIDGEHGRGSIAPW